VGLSRNSLTSEVQKAGNLEEKAFETAERELKRYVIDQSRGSGVWIIAV